MDDDVTTLVDYFGMELPWLLFPMLIIGVVAGFTRYLISPALKEKVVLWHLLFVAMIGGIVFAQITVLTIGEYLPAAFLTPDPFTGALLIFMCGFFSVELFLFSIHRFEDRLKNFNGKDKSNGTKN